MNSTKIHQIYSTMQHRHDGKVTMQGLAFTNLIHNVIREYGKYDGVNYTVYMSDIDNTDRKLLLSHVCDSEDYQQVCESTSYLDAMWNENKKYLQDLIDAECHEVYSEDMEEMGMISRRHPNYDESCWIRG